MTRQLPLELLARDRPSFENFWAADNGAALSAAQAVALGRPGPLYLFGPKGCGKTHLLVAAARAAQAHGPCAYLSLASLSPAAWEGVADLPHDSVACIDDVEALAGDAEGERRLFVLFEMLAPARRLVLAGRSNPAGLPVAREDLRTRLASGPIVAMHRLSDEAKAQAVRHRAALRGLHMGDAASRYLLAHGPRDPRALFALLEDLDRETLADGRRLTIPYLRAILARA
ncbi:DnaA regulatory inactivator Hda [Acidiferrobacter sp.]|uniref:DnaA regulatory inactivator Hda n=1 Tax=Acidiferrobacter sp. TaxID=1872107 RepID=UPI0026074796|nr:DnaA regulatory inactivator Hda [Acidiferrobacter sp.]